MTPSCHRCLGLPTGLVPICLQSNSFPVGLAWSIHWICPSYLILCALMNLTISAPSINLSMSKLFRSEIIPTRCNNCVYSSHSEKQHGITRQCYLQLNTTDNDNTTRILTKLQHKYTCLPERPYTALYSWWWVELSPEICRVKPLRRINAIVASCWIYFTMCEVVSGGSGLGLVPDWCEHCSGPSGREFLS